MLACAGRNPDRSAASITFTTAGPGVMLNMKFVLQKEIASAKSMCIPHRSN
jgi:hypothetical protein